MPRGRHRHSPPLHRLLPPSALAGAAVVCAAGAWLSTDPLVLRATAAAAAVTAVVAAVVMRHWDRVAGKRVADLVRARQRDEWRHEERIAELESDLDESRVLRGKLENKLRAKRVELAGLRNEHAALLRRYATAETERATALERRRLLEIEAAGPARTKEAAGPVSTEVALVHRGLPTPGAYLRAAEALRNLGRKKAATSSAGTQESSPGAPELPSGAPEGKKQGKPASSGVPHGHYVVPAAVAVVPQQPVRPPVPRLEGGFDFFGAQKQGKERAVLEAVQNEDLADVAGAEALEVHKAQTEAEAFRPASAEQREAAQVIDLTAHDETEQLDVADLRSAIS